MPEGGTMDAMTGGSPLETILWTARSAGATLIISRGNDPATIRQLLDEGLVRERLGHLVLTIKGLQRRRACAPY
ncbi:hypothetical protein QP166_16075 [Sphingomonas sp. LR60]|uniref:hypothetical protein n=1 Tax=Sphingomonas sp. LR60 TaxID=3050233 RepID=UPI002FE263C2